MHVLIATIVVIALVLIFGKWAARRVKEIITEIK